MKRRFFSIILSLLLIFSCSDNLNTIYLSPSQAILGKWEEVKYGNWPSLFDIVNPTEYTEFLEDSIMRSYEYATGKYSYGNYWVDSLLNEFAILEDGTKLVTPRYYYQFSDNYNTLRLDMAGIPAIFTTFIFKRKI